MEFKKLWYNMRVLKREGNTKIHKRKVKKMFGEFLGTLLVFGIVAIMVIIAEKIFAKWDRGNK